LHLGAVPHRDRPMVLLLLLALLASSALLVMVTAGGPLPGGQVLVAGRLVGEAVPIAVPLLPVMLAYLGAAAAAGAMLWGGSSGWTRFGVGIVGIHVAVRAVQLVQSRALPEGDLLRGALAAAGLAVVVLAAIAVLVPGRTWRRGRSPLLVAPLLFPILVTLAGWFLAPPDDEVTALVVRAVPGLATFGPDIAAAIAFTTLVYLVPAVLLPYLLWQAAAWARASRREIAIDLLGSAMSRYGWVVPLLVALKGVWLVAGYLSMLPHWLGGGRPVWSASLADGPVGWLIAAGFAVVAGGWLLHRRRVQVDETALRPATAFIVAGFSVAVVIAVSLTFAAAIATFAGPGPTAAFVTFGVVALDAILPTQAVTVVLAGVVAVGLLWYRGPSSPALFLLVFAAWALPRAVGVALAPDSPSSPAAVEVATLDAVLTAMIALVTVLWYSRRQRRVEPLALGLILVVSTLLAHGGTLIPADLDPAVSVIALLFPVGYVLLFNAGSLGAGGDPGDGQVVRRLAVVAIGLLVVATGLAAGGTPHLASPLGTLLFAVPFTWMLVGASISRADPSMQISIDPVVGRSPRGAIMAALTLVLIGGVSAVSIASTGGQPLPPDARLPKTVPAVEAAGSAGGYAALELEVWYDAQMRPAIPVLQALDAALGPDLREVRDVDGVRRAGHELQRLAALRTEWTVPDADAECARSARVEHGRVESSLLSLAAVTMDHATDPGEASAAAVADAGRIFSGATEAYLAAFDHALHACPGIVAAPGS
jgi:hypothetical protein